MVVGGPRRGGDTFFFFARGEGFGAAGGGGGFRSCDMGEVPVAWAICRWRASFSSKLVGMLRGRTLLRVTAKYYDAKSKFGFFS